MTERLGRPPALLPKVRAEEIWTVPAGTAVGRIHFLDGAHPTAWNEFRQWGPVSSARFDHHPEPQRTHAHRGISYCAPSINRLGTPADTLETCLREVYGPLGLIDRFARSPWFTVWELRTDLTLLDLVDSPWIARVGGNAAISSGVHGTSRRWSAAIYRSYPDVQGLYYEAATLPRGRSLALYERAAAATPKQWLTSMPLARPALRPMIQTIADRYDMTLI